MSELIVCTREELARVVEESVARALAAASNPPPVPDPDEWLTPREAAAILKCSWQRLETLRRTGGGPRFVKEGRLVRYLRADVEKFKATRPVRRSTAEVAVAATAPQRRGKVA